MNEELADYIKSGLIKHDLKIAPRYFLDVLAGRKKFEIRFNDRDYQVGDIFIMREWDGEYTGRYLIKSIGYVLKDCPEYGLMEGYCIFGW